MDKLQKQNRRYLFLGLLVVVLVFLGGYALVPLYNVICNKFGVNGKPTMYSVNNTEGVDKSRVITVEFLSTVNDNLPWDFRPEVKRVEVHPGEDAHLAFYAKNNSEHIMTVQAIPSITPGLAASHLKKTECFCFNQQTLQPHQAMDMPLIFHIDNELPKNIHEVTLSYTLFEAKKSIENKIKGKL